MLNSLKYDLVFALMALAAAGLVGAISFMAADQASAAEVSSSSLYDAYVVEHADNGRLLVAQLDLGTSADIDVGADLDADTTTTDADVSTDASIDAGAEVDADTSPLILDRDSLNQRTDTSTATGSGVTTAAQVSSRADLDAYASSALLSDPRIEEAELSSESVSIHYRQPARLFGFIPVSITAKAVADASGNVEISYPWYGFLVAKADRAEIESQIEADLRTALAASGQTAATTTAGADVAASTTLSARAQAELFENLRTALETSAESTVDVETR
jgi:hypothetical protein